ncbi:MAG: tripartite tricarboxylate transporter substrate binding protein [Pseudomonadota bacterium]
MSNKGRREILQLAAGAASVLACPGLLHAQPSYPSRPIRVIFPFSPGGTGGVLLTAVCQAAGKHLGGNMFVDYKPGASGTLGPAELLRGAPDGYTLSQIHSGVWRLPHIQKVPFNPLEDFSYIICMGGYVFGLMVRADSPFKTIADVVTYAKANPGKFSFGSQGNNTTGHLAVEDFAFRAGIKLLHIPFKGDPEGNQAVLGGHIMAHSSTSSADPLVESGQCRLLATFGSERAKRWPNVPTLKESGYDTVFVGPWGIGGPKGLDPAITARLHDAFKAALQDSTVRDIYDKAGLPVLYLDTADYTKFVRDSFYAEKALIDKLGFGLKT